MKLHSPEDIQAMFPGQKVKKVRLYPKGMEPPKKHDPLKPPKYPPQAEVFSRFLSKMQPGEYRSLAETDKHNAKMLKLLSGISPCVYFVRAHRYVKIGTATELAKRLSGIQTGCPIRVELLWAIEGGREKERELHNQFKFHRLHSEWFVYGDEIKAFLADKVPQE